MSNFLFDFDSISIIKTDSKKGLNCSAPQSAATALAEVQKSYDNCLHVRAN